VGQRVVVEVNAADAFRARQHTHNEEQHQHGQPDLMALDEAGWEAFSRGSPLRRAGRAGFLRNVAVALGNWGSSEAVPALVAALSDPEPFVREHAVWALAEIGSAEAVATLEALEPLERDPLVRDELGGARQVPTEREVTGRVRSAPERDIGSTSSSRWTKCGSVAGARP
jgi:hypothetical protein